MPRTALTITAVSRAATAQPAQVNSDVGNGNSLPFNPGGLVLEIQNANVAARTVTIGQPALQDGVATAGKVITVPGSTTIVVGNLAPALYNQPDGTVNLDASGVSGDIKYRIYQAV